MKIPTSEYAQLKQDIATACYSYSVDFSTADGGKTGLKTMWALFDTVCKNRSYDDSHPFFKSGQWIRCLPFTGRKYCWLYDLGLNDTHIATALKNIKNELTTAA